MEDNQVIRPPESTAPEKKGSGKTVLFASLALILILALAAGAYFFGKNSSQKISDLSPTPTQSIFPTISTEVMPLEPTSTPSGTLTPTKSSTLTPTATPTLKTKILTSVSGLDGFRSSNNGGNDSVDIRTGRNSNLVTRGFVTYDLSDLPTGANIQSATLRLYQSKVTGSPYSVGGALKIDHLTYGDSLDSTDYSLPALISNIATLTTNATIEWKDADVTDSVKNDISNARSRSQFRLHFTTETTGGDVTGDFAYFDSANSYADSSGHTPQLVVKYY